MTPLRVRPSSTIAPIAASLAITAAVPIARADPLPGTTRLSWVRGDGAEQCPDASVIESRVAGGLGHDPFSREAAQSLEVFVRREGAGWVASVRLRDAHGALVGTREIRSDETGCDAIADDAVVALTLAIDPAAHPNATRPSPSQRASTPPAPASSREGALTLRSGIALGVLPRVAPSIGIAGELQILGRFRARVAANFYPEVSLAADATYRAAFGLTDFVAAPCLDAVSTVALRFALCVTGHVGVLHAVLFEITPTDPGQVPWGAVGFAPALRLRVARHLALEAELEALANLTPYRFVVTGRSDPVFVSWPVVITGSIALGWAF